MIAGRAAALRTSIQGRNAVRKSQTNDRSVDNFRSRIKMNANNICSRAPGVTPVQSVRAAVTSTSTLNSGRVKPETITSVEAKAFPDT